MSGLKIRSKSDRTFIATAHHANDNIETVLMNFSEARVLKAAWYCQNKTKLYGPFVCKKDDLVSAETNKLAFVTDYTNGQSDFTRNYFRNELIPAVQKVFPAAEDNLLNNITRLGEAGAIV